MRTDAPPRWLVAGTSVLAVLLAIGALAGMFDPSIYARETRSWAAQGFGQDFVDLVIVAPMLLACAFGVARKSRTALLALAGVLLYVVYSFFIYAFAMHFNALFLIYCATLGVAFFALVDIAVFLIQQRGWFPVELRYRRLIGGFLIGLAASFSLLWLSPTFAALLAGTEPPQLAEAGLITNPVHVLDLSIVLPAMAFAGVLVLQRRPGGTFLAVILLAFNVVMATAIVGMNIAMLGFGVPIQPVVPIAIITVAAVSKLLALAMLRQLIPGASPRTAATTEQASESGIAA